MYKKMFLLCLIPLCTQATEVENVHLNFSDGQASVKDLIYHKPTISRKTSIVTSFTALCSALLSGYGTYLLISTSPRVTNPYTIYGIPVLIGGLIGSLAGFIVYCFEQEGQFESARNTLFNAVKDPVLNQFIADQSNLLKNIDHTYVKDSLPRTNAYFKLHRYYVQFEYAILKLNNIIEQSDDKDLVAFAKSYLPIISEYKKHVGTCLETIKSDPKWNAEYNSFQLRLNNEMILLLILIISKIGLEYYYTPPTYPYYYRY